MLKLQVFDADQWGTLNTIAVGSGASAEALLRATGELLKAQSAWSANYDRFKESNVKFRIARE